MSVWEQALAISLAVGLGLLILCAVAWTVACDLIDEALDEADPMAAFADDLVEGVDQLLQRSASWAPTSLDFQQWEKEVGDL